MQGLDINDEDLSNIAITSMTGKSVDAPHFSPILSGLSRFEAKRLHSVPRELRECTKQDKETSRNRKLVRGLVLRRRVPSDNAPNKLEDVPAVIRGDLKIRKK